MGNLCSVVLRGIDYILRLIFPRYAAAMLEGYYPVSEEHERSAVSNSTSSTPQISDSFSNPAYGRFYRVEEPEENEDQMPPAEDNTEYIRSIVNNFFEVHNLQKEALTKNITEKFLDLYSKVNNDSSTNIITKNSSEKEVRDSSRSEERQHHHTNSKAMSSSGKILKANSANQKPKTSVLNACLNTENKENDSYLANKTDNVDLVDCRVNKYLIERDNINTKCIENTEYRQRKCGKLPHEEILLNRKEICENFVSSSKEISANGHSNDGYKSGMVPSKEVIRDQKLQCKKFASSCKEILPNDDSDDEYAHEVEVGKRDKLCLRKISLNKLYSGSHYAVINNDENIELSDYSKEFPPLQVEDGICYRKFTHPNLLSGGAVVYQELSDHLSIRNWYKENPIVYNEIPGGIKAPQSSPVSLQQVEPFTFPISSSRGGIVSDAASQKVYLPDMFPGSSGPLSQTYSPLVNTQSSTSFGDLQTATDKTTENFTDLLKESFAHDTQLTSKISEEENTQT